MTGRLAPAGFRRPQAKALLTVLLKGVSKINDPVDDRGGATLENPPRCDAMAKPAGIGIMVNPEHRPIERHASEKTARAGIGVDLGLEGGVCGQCRVSSHWPCRDGCVGPQREFAVDHPIHTATGTEHQNHVSGLDAGLETDTAASQSDEARVAEGTIFATHGNKTAPVSPANYEASLDDIGNDGHGLGIPQQITRDTAVRTLHDFAQHPDSVAGA